MLSNVSESYTGNTNKSGSFCKLKSPAFFEPVSAALLLLETAVMVTVWLMNLLEAFPAPLLETVLQLIEQYNQ